MKVEIYSLTVCVCICFQKIKLYHVYLLPEIEVPLSHIPNKDLAAVILIRPQDLSEIEGEDLTFK